MLFGDGNQARYFFKRVTMIRARGPAVWLVLLSHYLEATRYRCKTTMIECRMTTQWQAQARARVRTIYQIFHFEPMPAGSKLHKLEFCLLWIRVAVHVRAVNAALQNKCCNAI